MVSWRNASGAVDPVQHDVCQAETEEEKRVRAMVRALKIVAAANGFEFEGRFALKDKETGKVWRQLMRR